MKRKNGRLIAVVLAVVMCVTLLPVTALANPEGGAPGACACEGLHPGCESEACAHEPQVCEECLAEAPEMCPVDGCGLSLVECEAGGGHTAAQLCGVCGQPEADCTCGAEPEAGGDGLVLAADLDVVYKGAGEEGADVTVSYLAGETYAAKDQPNPPAAAGGKVFAHWYEESANPETPYTFSSIPAEGVTAVNLVAHYTDKVPGGDGEEGEDEPGEPRFVNFYISYEDGDYLYGSRAIGADGVIDGNPFTLLASFYPAGKTQFKYWGESAAAAAGVDFTQPLPGQGDVDVYAVFDTSYLVTFLNIDNVTPHTVTYQPGEPVIEASSGVAGTPGPGVHFAYWYEEGTWTEGDGGVPQPFVFNVACDRDVTLVPYFSNLYYVIYVSAGTQVPFATVEAGEPVAQPPSPTRTGYTFNYWSTDEEGLNKFTFGESIDKNTFLYAQWTAKSVQYKVVYWREKANIAGDPGTDTANYEFFKRETKTALAGTPLNLERYPTGLTTVPYATYVFANTASTEVLGSGTSVVNVYFKRNIYTFLFDLNPGNRDTASYPRIEATMDFNGRVYAQGRAEDGSPHPGEMYSFQAKFEQDIENLWPSSWNASFVKNQRISANPANVQKTYFTSWYSDGLGANYVTKRFTVTEDYIPQNGVSRTFTANWGTVATRQVNYWLERLPHENNENSEIRVYNGIPYVKSEFHSQAIDLEGALDAKIIEGVTYKGASNQTVNGTYTYNFFYARNRFNITFDTQGGNNIPGKSGVMYGTRLSTPGLQPAMPTKILDGVSYRFLGWSRDAEGNYPVEFSDDFTMPNQNLTLFAQWESQAHTVTFYDDFIGGEQLAEVGSGRNTPLDPGRVAEAVGFAPGDTVPGKGVFKGWYVKMPVGFVGFSFDTPINSDLELYAGWTTDGFKVTYDLNGGVGTTPVVNYTYRNGETTRLRDFEAAAPGGKVFVGWKAEYQGAGSGTVHNPGDYYPVYGDVKFVAQYGEGSEYVAIRYLSNYPTGLQDDERHQNVLRGADNTLYSGVFSTPNGVLVGWATTRDATVAEYPLGGTMAIPADAEGNPYYTTLYGVWEQNVPRYTVTFNTDGNGRVMDENDIPQNSVNIAGIYPNSLWGAAIGEAPEPVPNTGYYFAGWEPTLPDAGEEITKNMTFTAKFAPKREVRIVGNTGTYTYNGASQTVKGATVTGLPTGYEVYIGGKTPEEVSVATTNASDTRVYMDINWNDVLIYDDNGGDVTEQYYGTITDGWVEINRRPVTLTIADEWAWYANGAPVERQLAVTAQPMGADVGLVDGETVTPYVTASGNEVGTTTYGDASADVPAGLAISGGNGNYDITIENGTFEIKPLRTGLAINLLPLVFTYDGTGKGLDAAGLAAPIESTPTYYYRVRGD